jgi:hypothetical protein
MCFDADDGTASCYGDGGGPAFTGSGASRAVVGLGSGGTASSCTDGLDIYTAVAAELPFIDTYLPATTPPVDPTDPTDPTPVDPDDPDGPARGDEPTDGSKKPPVARGCSAGGGAGWLLVFGIALAIRRRRR